MANVPPPPAAVDLHGAPPPAQMGGQVSQTEYDQSGTASREPEWDEFWLDALGRNIFGDGGDSAAENTKMDDWKRRAAVLPPNAKLTAPWQAATNGQAPPPTLQASSPCGGGQTLHKQPPPLSSTVGPPGSSPGLSPPGMLAPMQNNPPPPGSFNPPQQQAGGRPVEPAYAPWASEGDRWRPRHTQPNRAPLVEEHGENRRRFGPTSSEGQSDVWNYYNMKNNQLTRSLAHMRNVWCFVGLFVLLMLVMIPVWNADWLLKDPAFVYFAGRTVPRAILSVCIALPIIYVCIVSLLFKRGELKFITEQTMLGVSVVFLTTLGLALMLISMPMQYFATNTYRDIVYSCTTAPKSRELFQTSQALHLLRRSSKCATQLSVTACAGFESTVYTEVLEAMELRYQCSGFCYEPQEVEEPKVTALLQVRATVHRKSTHGEQKKHEAFEKKMPTLLQVQTEGNRIKAYRKLKRRQGPSVSTVSSVIPSLPRFGDDEEGRSMDVVETVPALLPRFEEGRSMDVVETVPALLPRFEEDSLESTSDDSFRYADSDLYSQYSGNPAGDPGVAQKTAGKDIDVSNIVKSAADDKHSTNENGDPSVDTVLPKTFDPMMNASLILQPLPTFAPTLFTLSNWQASCDGMAANAMQHNVGDMSAGAFYQGVVLMALAVGVGFMQLLGLCAASKYR
eukprot:TRINITY_DN5315_c0_g1_i2.p1 TRINITY_DN5315_c0_g1~~TRINITY_DN5315_c0_g1_i2.p1  ORF type:complete len:678 (+),score=107.38 TRINITY_DN5315_c0_g1_i2:123-2156(+)